MNSPLVTGVHPVLGWARADEARRLFAVLAIVHLLSWPLLAGIPHGGDVVVGLALTVGPPSFYSAARVLRPHLVPDAERRVRHALASTSTTFGFSTLILLTAGSNGDSGILVLVPAALGLLITVPWGLVALVIRALQTPVPNRPIVAPAAAARNTIT